MKALGCHFDFPRGGAGSGQFFARVIFFPQVNQLAQEAVVALPGSPVGIEFVFGCFSESDGSAAQFGHAVLLEKPGANHKRVCLFTRISNRLAPDVSYAIPLQWITLSVFIRNLCRKYPTSREVEAKRGIHYRDSTYCLRGKGYIAEVGSMALCV